jgi:hypothetical protein
MIGERDEIQRPMGTSADPLSQRTERDRRLMARWGLPALLVAVALVGALMLFGRSDDRTRTATNNNSGTIVDNVPKQTPPPIPNKTTNTPR